MKVYFIPGLGADKRMYQYQLQKIYGEVLEYITPEPNETIESYARRLAQKIDTSKPFALVGTSLGGMMAIEIARFLEPKKIILIASVKSRKELPLWLRSIKHLQVHRLIHFSVFKKAVKFRARLLKGSSGEKVAQLVSDMADSVDDTFYKWAINAVINSKTKEPIRKDIIHIHGTSDPLFPIKNIQNCIPIKGGTHIMNLTMPEEVTEQLLKALNS